MPCGPDQTRPVGTQKQFDLVDIVDIIDHKIKKSEGNTFSVYSHSFLSRYSRSYCDDIGDLYKKAGWLHAYWIINPNSEMYDQLILSNDPEHKDLRIKPAKKTWWQKVKQFFGAAKQ